ncbi:hypothetical protein U9M48_041853, partial [Paspalum notatum var. saurae]
MSFAEARNLLVLKELRLANDAKNAAATALLVGTTSSSSSCSGGCKSSTALTATGNSGGNGGGRPSRKTRWRKGQQQGGAQQQSGPRPTGPWVCFGPWTGPQPAPAWRPSAPGLLGPYPQANTAFAGPQTSQPRRLLVSTGCRLAATAGAKLGPGGSDCCPSKHAAAGRGPRVMDTGATSHMTSSDGILLSRTPPSYSSITVGNGTSIPVIAQGHSLLPASSSRFNLNNVLVVPSLVRNLLSVRQFTRDNSCSVEFDPFGFSVKDLQTRREILRCASSGDLYTFPAEHSSVAHAYLAVPSVVWHQRLGHPAPATLASLQNSGVISCNKADNGREFINTATASFLASRGTLLRLSCPYTSPQNGKAERIIRTLNNSTRTLLLHASMPPKYWAEALATATYLLNRRPSSSIQNRIPFQLLYGVPPDLAHLRVFGCLCYPNLSATAAHKLAPRSTTCVFIGYPSSHKGYRCLDLATHRVIISRHVVFDETTFPFAATSPSVAPSLDFLVTDDVQDPYVVMPVVAPPSMGVEQPLLTADAPFLADVEQPRPSPGPHGRPGGSPAAGAAPAPVPAAGAAPRGP